MQLVTRHARARDLADDRRVDAEVLEGLDERRRGSLRDIPRDLVRSRRAAKDAAVGEAVLLVGLDRTDVEQAGLIWILPLCRVDEQTWL